MQIDKFGTYLALGAGSAVIAKTISTPLDCALSERAFSGRSLGQSLVGLIREVGLFGLWRGHIANLSRYVPTQALNFALYEYFKNILRSGKFSRGILAKLIKISPFSMLSSYFRPMDKISTYFVAGSFAGLASMVVTYPLDYCRTVLAQDDRKNFKNLGAVFSHIFKEDGITGLYQGFGMSVLGVAIYRGALFGLYETIHSRLYEAILYKLPLSKKSFLYYFLVAWLATSAASYISYPIDTVRRYIMRYQSLNPESNITPSFFQTALFIIQNEGLFAFWRGSSANIFRSVAGALTLAFYTKFQSML